MTSGWSDADGDFYDEEVLGVSAGSFASSAFSAFAGRRQFPPVAKSLRPSPGAVREETASYKMKAPMQEQMLVEAARREASQCDQFSSFLDHLKETEISKNGVTSRVMAAQEEFFYRQGIKRAFNAFQNPTPIQGQMFSDLMTLRPGGSTQPVQHIGSEARKIHQPIEQPAALQPTQAAMAIDNGRRTFITRYFKESPSRTFHSALTGPRSDIAEKLAALENNRALLAGGQYAMTDEEFGIAKLEILTSRYDS